MITCVFDWKRGSMPDHTGNAISEMIERPRRPTPSSADSGFAARGSGCELHAIALVGKGDEQAPLGR